MEQALVAGMPDDQFLNTLNKITGMSGSLPVPPRINFKGDEGIFYIDTGEKDNEGKPVKEPLGESIKLHIVMRKNMINSRYNPKATTNYYSREFSGDMFDLYEKKGDSEAVNIGSYSWQGLKNSNNPTDQLLFEKLQFNQALYAYLLNENEPKLVRLVINGSKFAYWFPYVQSFQNSSPVLFETVLSKGKALSSGDIEYFELLFKKGEAVDKQLIIQRVTDVNSYIQAYQQAKQSQVSPSIEFVFHPTNSSAASDTTDDTWAAAQGFTPNIGLGVLPNPDDEISVEDVEM